MPSRYAPTSSSEYTMAAIAKNQRSTQERGVPATPAWEHLREQMEDLDRKRVYRFAYPDGSKYETAWQSESAAKGWASINGHRYLGEVRSEPRVEWSRSGLDSRGADPDLSPPPLVEAQASPPRRSRPRLGSRGTDPDLSPPPLVEAQTSPLRRSRPAPSDVLTPEQPVGSDNPEFEFWREVIKQINPFESREERVKKVRKALEGNGFDPKQAQKEATTLIRNSGEVGELLGGFIANRLLGPIIRRWLIPPPVLGVGPVKRRPNFIGPRRPSNPRPTVQAGHTASKDLRKSGWEERLALEDSSFNVDLSGNVIESKGAYSIKDVIDIGGVPVERRTAILYARELKPRNFPSLSEVINAPSAPGRLAPKGITKTEDEFIRWARNAIVAGGNDHPLRFLLE
jgi:hypothetical protein